MTCVSPSPSKIPYGEFSPVRLQTDCRRRPSPLATMGSMQSTSPCASALYAATAQVPSDRGPCGQTLAGPCGPIGTIANDQGTSVQRPLARQPVLLSRRVNAYYGLIRASGPAALVAVHQHFTPEETALGGRARGSPIYSAELCDHAVSRTPVAHGLHLVVPSSAVLAFART
jgi:hypothetical protein